MTGFIENSNNRSSGFFRDESKIEKVPRGIRGEKSSKDMASSRNLVVIVALASPEMGDGTRKVLIYSCGCCL